MADLSDNTNWFETDASNNKASPNGWPEGMMPVWCQRHARAGTRVRSSASGTGSTRCRPITPSGGVWTFTTSNTAYPTAYVDGEIYCFQRRRCLGRRRSISDQRSRCQADL